MTDELVRGGRAILVARPTGHDSKDFPLTLGAIYYVADFEGSNVHLTDPARTDDRTFPVNRSRVRAATPWVRTEGGNWECHCDGARFLAVRVGRAWTCRTFADGDQWGTGAHTRDAALVELYEMVRYARDARAREEVP